MLRVIFTDVTHRDVDAESFMCPEGETLLRKRNTEGVKDGKGDVHPFLVVGTLDTRTVRDIEYRK